MELTRKKRARTQLTINGSMYLPRHDVEMYGAPPKISLELEEFYELAVERLKVLRLVEQTLIRISSKNMDEKRSAVLYELKKQGFKTYAKLLMSTGTDGVDTTKERRDDYLSHFILRLAHCQTDNLKQWFLKREMDLFRLRFHSLNLKGVRNFLEAHKLDYSPISEEEKSLNLRKLINSTANMSHAAVESMDFYKVFFFEVNDLVLSRKVFLKDGYAYVPSRDIISVVMFEFKMYLQGGLMDLAANLANLEEDERLRPMLNLHKMELNPNYELPKNQGTITVGDLDPLSRSSFPPCMRQIHEYIREKHHVKHGARLQYGLYLKAIGLSLEESIKFWRDEFTKKMPTETFQSHYEYSIRHHYGQEGKRISYSGYSCAKIINSSVGIGECHGCPFRHSGQQILKQQLESYGISFIGIQAIMDFVLQKKFDLACTKYFELMHPSTPVDVIYHPNQFFALSREVYSGGEDTSRKQSKSQEKFKEVKTEKGVSAEAGTSTECKGDDSFDWDSMNMDFSEIPENI